MVNIQPIKFLGCSVVNFTTSLGLNSNPSTLSVTLVEDPDISEDFLADSHSPTTTQTELQATYGGTPFTNGNPGTFASFQTPDGSFSFKGIVTGYRRTKSVSGSLIYVELSDPRFLLANIPIINDVNLDINTTDFHTVSWNIFCAPSIFSNPVTLDWSARGVAFDALFKAIEARGFNFYGRNFKILLDTSFYGQLAGGYRLKQQSGSIEDVISQAAKDNGLDWYATCQVNAGGYEIISIRGLKRKNDYNFVGSNGLYDFINNRIDRVSSWEIGRELRQEPSVTIVTGDRVRTLWNTSPNGTYNIFTELGNGMAIDRPFVSLDFGSSINWLNYPTVLISVSSTETNPSAGNALDQYGNSKVVFPTRTKTQKLKSKKGYIATETVLRAALHSKDSWATAIWYEYRDLSSGTLKTVQFNKYNSFDLNYGFGAATSQVLENFSMSPTALGIYAPPFDVEKGSHTASSVLNQADAIAETIKEAAYQATLRVAQEYYGKKFMCRLPTSAICTQIGNSYVNNQKKIPIEYEVVDGAPDVATYTQTTPIGFPDSLLLSDSAGFRNQNGLFRPFAYFNTRTSNGIPSTYNYVKYEQFNPYNSVWGDTDVAEGTKNQLFYSGVSVELYRFDPRFAVVTLNEPFNCGIGTYKNLIVTARDSNNKITSWTLVDAYSPINKSENKGGFLEFLQRILKIGETGGFTIVVDSDADLIINGIKQNVNTSLKKISVEHYNYLINSWLNYSEHLNLAEFRLTNFDRVAGCGFYLPLQWNYIKYGPWVFGTNIQRPVQFLEDSKLTPWNYGGFERMNTAGGIIAERANSSMHTTAYASVTVEGYPEFNIGHGLVDTSGYVMADLTDINMGFGMEGINTTYKFKSYFGPIGFTKRSELDTISYNSFSASANQSTNINVDKIWEDFEAQYIKAMGGPNPNANIYNKNGFSSFMAGINSNGQAPDVTIKNPQSTKFANQSDSAMYQNSAEAKLSSLFIPYSTISPSVAKNKVPTIEGGLI
jgi:hypothetical protein